MVVQVKQGHVLDVLAGMPAKSVHVCVTSPPYWGLRSYQTPPQVWGGVDGCEHEWGPAIVDHKRGQDAGASARAGNTVARVCPPTTQQGAFCQKCGAWRGELGSEPTLDLFVSNLVTVFEAVKRVLRDDGTLWCNLGDSYANDTKWGGATGGKHSSGLHGADSGIGRGKRETGLKAGDLCMAPARFALAMQAAGWTLRSQIVLPKTAPMPESVQSARWEKCRTKLTNGSRNTGTRSVGANPAHGKRDVGSFESDEGRAEWADCPGCPKCDHPDPEQRGYVQRWGSWRPTSAYEVLYLFSKAGQRYFADGEAVRMPVSAATLADGRTARGQRGTRGEYGTVDGNAGYNPAGRNLWNYVMWAPEPSSLQHFAAYPRFIPRLAIQAGTSERGVCPTCAAPWLRVVERGGLTKTNHDCGNTRPHTQGKDYGDGETMSAHLTRDGFVPGHSLPSTTVGWRQSCTCAPHSPVPSTVLDPFSGSGTTLIEANALGRHGIGVELQAKYVAITHHRLAGEPLSLFAHEGAAAFAGAEVDALETTKQEQHPNRTVAGFNQRYKAKHGAVGVAPEAAG